MKFAFFQKLIAFNKSNQIRHVLCSFHNKPLPSYDRVNKNLTIPSSLSAREAEILADQVTLYLAEGCSHFRFLLQIGFLPTLGWMERFRELLTPIVAQKKTVEMVANSEQKKSLRQCGFHLIGDLEDSNPAT